MKCSGCSADFSYASDLPVVLRMGHMGIRCPNCSGFTPLEYTVDSISPGGSDEKKAAQEKSEKDSKDFY